MDGDDDEFRPFVSDGRLVRTLLREAGDESDGVNFSDDSWYQTAVNTYAKETLFQRNIEIMDRYDPEKRVVMAVDEWGIWVDNEPGTAPGYLYQQNTMRSALCAALMLHIFHQYAGRIRIANLAQTINVLQSILLTEGAQMIKTPTYHVFDLLQGHQDGNSIPVAWDTAPETIQKNLAHVDVSASVKGDTLTVSLVNLSAGKEAGVELEIRKAKPIAASGRRMLGKPTDHNTFANPNHVDTMPLKDIAFHENSLRVTLPPCAIASVTVGSDRDEAKE